MREKYRSITYQAETKHGTAYITVCFDGAEKPVSILIDIGKAGSDIALFGEVLAKTFTLVLKRGDYSLLRELVEELRGFYRGCNPHLSLPAAVAETLLEVCK